MLVLAVVPRCFPEKKPQPHLPACSQRLCSRTFFPRMKFFVRTAYSEFYFCDTYWPAFRKIDLLRAIRSY